MPPANESVRTLIAASLIFVAASGGDSLAQPGLPPPGWEDNVIVMTNSAGRAIGYAHSTASEHPESAAAWYYDGVQTREIGIDAGVNGAPRVRKPTWLNEAGRAIGYTTVWEDIENPFEAGQIAWVYDPSRFPDTVDIGLKIPNYTLGAFGLYNLAFSEADFLTESGLVAGHAWTYLSTTSGTLHVGQTVWIYDGSVTRQIDVPTHTAGAYSYRGPNGSNVRHSEVTTLTENGRVIGVAKQYSNAIEVGWGAWYYDGNSLGQSLEIGLYDTEHSRQDGHHRSTPWAVSNSGKVIGNSERYDGSDYLGQSAWVFNGLMTVQTGLTSAEHTSSSGFRESYPLFIDDEGNAVGESIRFAGESERGQDTWLHNGMNTIQIGLHDSEHTASDGTKFSYVANVVSGRAVGGSWRYDGLDEAGDSAWYFDGNTTRNIGLTDAAHTSSNGTKYSYSVYLNRLGLVAGYSVRYGIDEFMGYDAWLYDPDRDTTSPIVLSVRSDGYADSNIDYLGDDGLAIGQYERFAGHESLGWKPFFLRPGGAPTELGQLIGSDFSSHKWEKLFFERADNSSYITIRALESETFVDFFYSVTIPDLGSADFNGDGSVDRADLAEWQQGFGVDPNADADGNGFTDGADFLIWQRQFSAGIGGPSQGDFDGDQEADGEDFLIWQRGQSPNPYSTGDLNIWTSRFGQQSATGALPEPGATALLLVGLLVSYSSHRAARLGRRHYFDRRLTA